MAATRPTSEKYVHELNELRKLLGNRARRSEAGRVLKRYVREHSLHGTAMRGVGELLLRAGEAQNAEKVLRESYSRLGPDPDVSVALSQVLLATKRPRDAVNLLASACKARPDAYEPHLRLGQVMARSMNFGGAIEVLRRARELRPGSYEAELVLAHAIQGWGRAHLAIPHYEAALAARPDSLEAMCGAALCQRLIGRFDESAALYRRARELRPELSVAIAGEAEVLTSLGRKAEALELLEGHLSQAHGVAASIATAYARVARGGERQQRAIELCERALKAPKLSAGERTTLLFALGDLYESAQQYERAFDAYRRGNESYGGAPYEAPAYERFVSRLMEVFAAGSLGSLARAATHSELPVFIVGVPRSGTSLVEQILAAHPQVFGGGEMHDIPELFMGLAGRIGNNLGYPGCLLAAGPDVIEEFSARHIQRLTEMSGGAARVTDKLPENFQHLGLIWMLHPKARIIHCRRDPVDTCLSCFTTQLSPAHVYAHDLHALGHFYHQYERLMAHWKQVLDLPILDVQYEELVADPEPHVRRLLEFCGLPWDEVCMRFHESKRIALTASIDQVRRPIYRTSVGRAERYGPLLDPLREALRAG